MPQQTAIRFVMADFSRTFGWSPPLRRNESICQDLQNPSGTASATFNTDT